MTRRRLAAALFPGDKTVWVVAAATAAVLFVVLLVALLQPRDVYTGSNSVGARNWIVELDDGRQLCARRQRVPPGTGVVRLAADRADPGVRAMRVTVELDDGRRLTGTAPHRDRYTEVEVPGLAEATDGRRRLATICMSPVGGMIGVWGQTLKQSNDLSLLLDGRPLGHRLAIWYRAAGDPQKAILLQLGDMFERASLFRPGGVGPWTYVLILGLVMPLVAYGAVRLVATADACRARTVALAVGGIAFVHAATWAVVTPAFQVPDEGEHYAAVQYLAETGRAVDANQGERPTWSSEEGVALEAIRYASVIERSDTDFPWDPLEERNWRARVADWHPPRDNGGGYHPATSTHAPAYYALLTPAYALTRERSTFTKLTAMRLTTAVMAALTALIAVLVALELLPGRRMFAAMAGLLVALLPVFGVMGGGVNNDMGVNLVAALLVLFVVRALRRGLTWPVGLGIGVALAAAPIMKGTAYALYPPVAFALLVLLWRHRTRAGIVALAALAAGFAVIHLGWQSIAGSFERSTYTVPGGGSPVTAIAARQNIPGFVSWLWQTLVPYRLPFMSDFTIVKWPFFEIYVKRGFASFGWYAFFFPTWVYGVIFAAGAGLVAIGVGGAVALWRRVRPHWAIIAFLILVPLSVFVGIEAAYFTTIALPLDGVAEQGRYAFTSLTAVAALAAGACALLGRRRGLIVGTSLVTAMMGLAYASQWLTLSSFYL